MWREGEELLVVVVVVSISSTYVCVWVRPGDTIGLNHGWKTRKKNLTFRYCSRASSSAFRMESL